MNQQWWIPVAAVAVIVVAAFLVYTAQEDEAPEVEEPEPVAASAPPPEPAPQPVAVETPQPAPPPPEPVAVPAAPTPRDDLGALLRIAYASLERLAAAIKRTGSTNAEILQPLEEVASAYRLLRAVAQGKPGVHRFLEDAEKQLLKAFKLEVLDERAEHNLREAVNVAAVEALGASGSERVSDQVIKALEKRIFRRKVDTTPRLLSASLDALADLADEDAVEWMIDRFTHSKSSPAKEVDRLVAAHRAMLRMDPAAVPGKRRYELVMAMIKTYSGVESLSQSGSVPHATELWDRIRCGVLAAARHFALHPKDDQGRALQTMEAFRVWYHDHKNPRRPPWTAEPLGTR